MLQKLKNKKGSIVLIGVSLIVCVCIPFMAFLFDISKLKYVEMDLKTVADAMVLSSVLDKERYHNNGRDMFFKKQESFNAMKLAMEKHRDANRLSRGIYIQPCTAFGYSKGIYVTQVEVTAHICAKVETIFLGNIFPKYKYIVVQGQSNSVVNKSFLHKK